MKYNYVVFGSDDPYYVLGYDELNHRNDSQYLDTLFCQRKLKKTMRVLRKIHMTPRIKKYIELPWKYIWNKRLYSNCFDNGKPICFLFFSAGEFTDHIPYGFVEYLKKEYPDSKYAVFYQDLVGSNKRTVSFDMFREKMDLLISFDYHDCKKYKMLYHPLVYSDIAGKIKELDEKSDIYFCGAEKNRLTEILEAYEFFNELGLKCDFNIITTNEELLKEQMSGIHYCRKFSYFENLRHIKSCNTMLEIMQKGGTGFTIRALECIAFNKKLITNNSYIKEAHFYNTNNIILYDQNKKAEFYIEFIKHKASSYEYMETVLPYELLQFIDDNL
ncbi:hypothetical protein [Eubacterium xylanophilum]|uniref:hypothetical protein n=1 Tax=Eubacterium xylanophilum TaxID=39497 RepID=UPI000479980A|nr:hypothetical protein [Eubacterium xylanophilum]